MTQVICKPLLTTYSRDVLFAIRTGRVQFLKVFSPIRRWIDECADTGLLDLEGQTTLHLAVEGGTVELLDQLLGARANINKADKWERSPLNMVASTRDREQEFLNNFFSDFRQRATGLAKMREYVDEEEIQTYLSEVDRGSKTYHSMDATSLVARICADADGSGSMAAIKALVKAFPTECCLLRCETKVAMVEELLRARAHVNRTNRRDETPLDAAIVVAGTHAAQVVRILVRGGGDKDRMNGCGDTPLIAAIRHKSFAPLCALIDCSADMEKTDRDGATPLYSAAWVGFSGALTLLAGSVEVDKANDCGDTALHAAAWQGHVDAVEQLVVAGAIISKANADGDAPLHVAAQRGHVKVVHFLIDQQADLAKRNVEGATAL
ncbi:ANKRD50, partial [Symbiodinium sp. KB8]